MSKMSKMPKMGSGKVVVPEAVVPPWAVEEEGPAMPDEEEDPFGHGGELAFVGREIVRFEYVKLAAESVQNHFRQCRQLVVK